MRNKELKKRFLDKLDQLVLVCKKDPSLMLSPTGEVAKLLHEFKVYQNAITKNKQCSFCFKKIKLKDLTHDQKVIFYGTGLCPACNSEDDNKSIFELVRKQVTN